MLIIDIFKKRCTNQIAITFLPVFLTMAADKIEEFDQAAFDALDKEAKEFDKVYASSQAVTVDSVAGNAQHLKVLLHLLTSKHRIPKSIESSKRFDWTPTPFLIFSLVSLNPTSREPTAPSPSLYIPIKLPTHAHQMHSTA